MNRKIYLSTKDSTRFITWLMSGKTTLEKDFLYLSIFYEEIYVLGAVDSLLEKNPNIKAAIDDQELFNLTLMFMAYNEHRGIDEDKSNLDYSYYDLAVLTYCSFKSGTYFYSTTKDQRSSRISQICSLIPEVEDLRRKSIAVFKDSFVKKDIADLLILNSLPSLSTIDPAFFSDLLDFKNSNEFSSLTKLYNNFVNEYGGRYSLSDSDISSINQKIISSYNKLMGLIDLRSVERFNLTELHFDKLSVVAGLMIPIFPLGTLRELIKYFKNKNNITEDMRGLLALMYITSLVGGTINEVPKADENCTFFTLIPLEVKELTEQECDEFFIGNSSDFRCEKHLTSSLYLRKFYGLTGKNLLMALIKI